MTKTSYVSTIDRLKTLPDVFTLSLMATKFTLSKRHAGILVSRMVDAGFAAPAGPRSGVYYNIFRTHEITGAMRNAALFTVYPSAILAGETVLHNAEWITQAPQSITVAVLSRPTYVKLDGFDIFGRMRSWFAKVNDALVDSDTASFSTFGLRSLPPAYALLDVYTRQDDAWQAKEDDLDIDDEGIQAINDAARVLGVKVPDFLEASMPSMLL
jgi:hypothetical protein